MTQLSENDALAQLGISNWRELSKDKFLTFAAMMPSLPSELALKVVEQFPSFKEIAVETLGKIEKVHLGSLDANSASDAKVHEAFSDVRRILEGELNKENLSGEEKANILSMLIATAERQAEKDTESKKFLREIFTASVSVVGIVVVAGLAFIGAKAAFETNNS